MANSPTRSKRIALLLDGDYLIFSALSAAEEEVDWGEDVWTLQCDHNKARKILQASINGIRKAHPDFKNAELVMVFSTLNSEDNWRKRVLPTYKANRKGKRKPVGYRDFMADCMADEQYLRTLQWHGLEGDDVIGICATNPQFLGVDEAIPVSCDKDFKTIPGRFLHLNPYGPAKLIHQTEAEADLWHMLQTLKGDTTDGYGGVPGVGDQIDGQLLMDWFKYPTYAYQAVKTMKSGPRKGQEVSYWTACMATEVFEDHVPDLGLVSVPTLWDCMVSHAEKAGMSLEDLIVQAQVARILRSCDFDWNNKLPIPWQPKG